MEYKHKAKCLVCGHSDMVFYDTKENYQEIRVCPKCNGAYVDVWKKHKYQNNANNEIEITMTNPNEPPKVMLNGQMIEEIVKLNYDYETSKYRDSGKHIFSLTYFDKETNTIQLIGQSRI